MGIERRGMLLGQGSGLLNSRSRQGELPTRYGNDGHRNRDNYDGSEPIRWLLRCREYGPYDVFPGHNTPMHHNRKENASTRVQKHHRHQDAESDCACCEQNPRGDGREKHVDMPSSPDES